jgi:hypothetical protein
MKAGCPQMCETSNDPRGLSFEKGTGQEHYEHISRSTSIAPTHARLCHAESERSPPSRKSTACIIGTNVSPHEIRGSSISIMQPNICVSGRNPNFPSPHQPPYCSNSVRPYRTRSSLAADHPYRQRFVPVHSAGSPSPRPSDAAAHLRLLRVPGPAVDLWWRRSHQAVILTTASSLR